jgi:hypothetical protein
MVGAGVEFSAKSTVAAGIVGLGVGVVLLLLLLLFFFGAMAREGTAKQDLDHRANRRGWMQCSCPWSYMLVEACVEWGSHSRLGLCR